MFRFKKLLPYVILVILSRDAIVEVLEFYF